MIYSYTRLWKKLIDKGMTKTEMQQQAGISTNILAKMGKGKPVAMESLAKICTPLNVSLSILWKYRKRMSTCGGKQ